MFSRGDSKGSLGEVKNEAKLEKRLSVKLFGKDVDFSKIGLEKRKSTEELQAQSPLIKAIKAGDLDLVKEELDRKSSGATGLLKKFHVTDKKNKTRKHTALHIAVEQRQEQMVAMLLEHGYDPNRPNETGNTPLHIVASIGNINIARSLLRKGASIALKNDEGKTPVAIAFDQPDGSTLAHFMVGYERKAQKTQELFDQFDQEAKEDQSMRRRTMTFGVGMVKPKKKELQKTLTDIDGAKKQQVEKERESNSSSQKEEMSLNDFLGRN
eukprot:Colp12_sorted_trinity150504_noHs@4421